MVILTKQLMVIMMIHMSSSSSPSPPLSSSLSGKDDIGKGALLATLRLQNTGTETVTIGDGDDSDGGGGDGGLLEVSQSNDDWFVGVQHKSDDPAGCTCRPL